MSNENGKKDKPEIEKAPGITQPTTPPPNELIIDIYTPKAEPKPTNGKGEH